MNKALRAAATLAFTAASFDTRSQQSGEDKPEDPPVPRRLETITVSAERVTGFRARTAQVGVFRDAELLDVPATINVVPRTVLDLQDAHGLFDALKNTAGVARSQVNGTAADNLSLRGIAIENRTSYRLNGGLPVNNLVEMPLENKERVEVLKGSSALYYGFTSPAGVVNLVTKRAQAEPIASVTVGGNEYGQYGIHADLGRQFGAGGELGVRGNFAAGEVRNAIDGYTGTRQLAAFAVDWRASDALSFRLDVEDIRRSAVEQATVGLNAAVDNVITLPRLPDPTKLVSGTWAVTSGNVVNFQGRADYTFNPDWAVMAEVGRAETNRERRESSQFLGYNVETGQGTLRVSLTRGQGYVNRNARTELSGHFVTGFVDHEAIVGFTRNERYQNGPGQQVVNLPQNLYDPVVLPEPILTQSLALSPQDITDDGLYAYDRIRIGEQWQVQVGVRRTDYTNISVGSVYAVKNSTPTYALIWKPRRDTSVYASYIEGLEEGGTAPLTTNNGGQVLAPGLSKQHEVGVRTEAFGRLTLTGAFFRIERASAYTNEANFFVLDGRTRYKGFEYAAVGELGERISLYLSGLFLDAKQENAQNAELIGKQPDNTPRQTHSLFAEYRPAFAPGLGVNAGAYYIGKRFINNLEQGSIPGCTTFNAGARYSMSIHGRATTFQAYVENLTDKRYWSAAGGGILSVGLPRTIKASVSVNL